MKIGVLVVMLIKHQSACDLSRFCHQFGAIPDSLELLWYWILPLRNKPKYNCKTRTWHMKDSGKQWMNKHSESQSSRHSLSLSLFLNTHILVISLWYQDVHLGALGADDVTAHRVFTQVDLAALCLVDWNGGNSSQHLKKNRYNISQKWVHPSYFNNHFIISFQGTIL